MRVFALAVALYLGACATTPPGPPTRSVQEVLPIVRSAAARYDLSPSLILGVIEIESAFKSDAVSSVGARGLMQLMPRTARYLARALSWDDYNIYDPEFNIHAGTAYLAQLMDRFDGDVMWSLTAYHGGPGRALKWQRERDALPPNSRRYAQAILAAQERYASLLASQSDFQEETRRGPTQGERDALKELVQRQLGAYPDDLDE